MKSAAVLVTSFMLAALAQQQEQSTAFLSRPVILSNRLLPLPSPTTETERVLFEQRASPTLEGQIINSDARFSPSLLPATFVARFSNGGFCTATLVGPRVLLTAAHCIDLKRRDSQGRWMTAPGAIKISGGHSEIYIKSCNMAEAYTRSSPTLTSRPRNKFDYALCELESAAGVTAETLNLAVPPVREAELLLAGYGCSEADLINGQIPSEPTSGMVMRAGTNRVYAPRADHGTALVGRVGTSDAIICPGDSGGAVYSGVDIANLPQSRLRGRWRVVAVASAVGLTNSQRITSRTETRLGREYVSYVAPLSSPAFLGLIESFTRPNHGQPALGTRQVCGFNRGHPDGCRE